MMAEHTAEFMGQYRKAYGRYGASRPDLLRCAHSVSDGMFGSKQCSRANGQGPHGAWCKQHDPVACKAKSDEMSGKRAKEYAAKKRLTAATEALKLALATIANGCDDPKGLAADVMAELNAAREALE